MVATADDGLETAVHVLATAVAAVHELSWKRTMMGPLFLAELMAKALGGVEKAAVGLMRFEVLVATCEADITTEVEQPHEAGGHAAASALYVRRVSRLLLCLLPRHVRLRPRHPTTTRKKKMVTSWAVTTTR